MRQLVPPAWNVLIQNKCRKSNLWSADIILLSMLTYFYDTIWKYETTACFFWCTFLLTPHSQAVMLRCWSVKVYWSCVEPYCSSSPFHRWRLEAYSGWLSPPVSMWWTLNYLADRSYLPPAPNRSLCQVLTSTSCQHTHYLTERMYAHATYNAQSAKCLRQQSHAGVSVNWNV